MTLPKPGDELKLRNGWPAKVLAVHPGQEWAIFIEYTEPTGKIFCSARRSNGCVRIDATEYYLDLMLPEPEPKQLCGWVNVYKKYNSCIHATRDEADAARDEDCLACLYIDIPYEEGGGL